MNRIVLVDAGPLVALRNVRDQHRDRVLDLARQLPETLYTCWPVLTEASYLLRQHPKEVQSLLHGFEAGNLSLFWLDDRDVKAVALILDKYADQGLSLADASLMHLAEREGIGCSYPVGLPKLNEPARHQRFLSEKCHGTVPTPIRFSPRPRLKSLE